MAAVRNTPSGNTGYTLIELMVAMAAATFFLVATMTIADISVESYRAQERLSDAQQSLRAALDLMVRDIRMAGYDPMSMSAGPTPGIGILEAADTRLQFSADLNADRMDSGGRENLTYFYDPVQKRLRQQEGGKAYPQSFIENVGALQFSYLDGNGNPAAELGNITTVRVSLTVEDRYKQSAVFKRTLETRINLRNLRMKADHFEFSSNSMDRADDDL